MTGPHRRANGFTLIELVASAVLTAMLMAGLMSIVWSSVRESAHLRQSHVRDASADLLVAQLRRDFQNARGMAVSDSQITLRGFLAEDRQTGLPTLLPGTVRYQRRVLANRAVLSRQAEAAGNIDRAVIWIGFDRLRIEPLVETDREDELVADPVAGGLPAVPAAFRVTMIGTGNRVIWREVIHHHAQ